MEHNRVFSFQLRDALEIALDQGDEDLLTVNVAKLFLHAAPMLHAFENYCVRQVSCHELLSSVKKISLSYDHQAGTHSSTCIIAVIHVIND